MKHLQAVRSQFGVDSRTEEVVNLAGAPAYHRSLREQVVQLLATGSLSGTFDVRPRRKGEAPKLPAVEAVELLTKARSECPDFLARAIVWARTEGCMRTMPILGLAILSGGGAATKSLFLAAFPKTVLIPDDLRSFVGFCKTGIVPGRKGLGGVARIAVRSWLETLSEYHALKYGSSASAEITLRDILRMAHAKPGSPALEERFGWLVRGVEGLGENPELNARIRSLEALKAATHEAEQVSLVREAGLPYEVVIPSLKATTPAVWEALMQAAPYGNLLRNLVTFTRHGVFQKDANVRLAVSKLTNPDAIKGSRVLPFELFKAWKVYSSQQDRDSRIADALRDALDLAFANLPSFGGRTVAVAPDVSGSMRDALIQPYEDQDRVSDATPRFIDACGVFTGALLKKIEGRAFVLPFEGHVVDDCRLSGRDAILTTTEKLAKVGGGSTSVGAPAKRLRDRKIKVDVFIGITDNVDWAYGQGYDSDSFFAEWKRYRNEVNPNAVAYLVTIAPHKEVVAPQGAHGIRFVYGWSDAVLKYISTDLETGSGQVDKIAKMSLAATRFATDADDEGADAA